MSENKVYYWLKLKEDFFEDDTIRWLEEQDNGKDYVLFYLKLCLKSLKSDGNIIRFVGDMLIPYDKKTLARVTNTDIDTVIVAIELFKSIGLIDIKETGEIYLNQINEMVGSETNKAELMRKFRAREKQKMLEGNIVTQMLPQIEKEIELDKEIDKELIKNKVDNVWYSYPSKKGKANAVKHIEKLLKKHDEDVLIQAIDRYKAYVDETRKVFNLQYQNGSTFFNKGIEDYIGENYEESIAIKPEEISIRAMYNE